MTLEEHINQKAGLELMDYPKWLKKRILRAQGIPEPPGEKTKNLRPKRPVYEIQKVPIGKNTVQIINKMVELDCQGKTLNVLDQFGFNSTEEIPKNICLWGPPGTGKTTIALMLLEKIANTRKAFYSTKDPLTGDKCPVWVNCSVYADDPSWASICWRLKEDHFKYKDQIIRKLKDVDFLLIDDLGSEMSSKDDGFDQTILWDIINWRISGSLSEFKRTVITTNLCQKEIDGKYRRNLADRLKDKNIKWISLIGPTFRR